MYVVAIRPDFPSKVLLLDVVDIRYLQLSRQEQQTGISWWVDLVGLEKSHNLSLIQKCLTTSRPLQILFYSERVLLHLLPADGENRLI